MTVKRQKILLADDHEIVLEGIRAALQEEPDFDIVGTASDGLKALEMVKALKPDIVVMDAAMPNLDGFEATKDIKKTFPAAKIIIYSMFSDHELIFALFQAGISGHVLKGRPISELVLALKCVADGGTFYSEGIRANLQEHLSGRGSFEQEEDIFEKLSAREKEVFVLLADGLPIKQIAERLFISPKTVESHKYNIMEKLGVNSVAQLTKIAVKKRLVTI